jgi:peptide-methionine (R)-S-oxide reductase
MKSHYPILIISAILILTCSKSTKKSNQVDIINDKTISHQESKPKTVVIPTIINSLGDSVRLVRRSNAEWKKNLSALQYYVLREKGTEKAFSGEFWEKKQTGLYTCAACGTVLFSSNAKYDSGTGWPSFYKVDDDKMIDIQVDTTHSNQRQEVICAVCSGQLGYLFKDGPPPTGLRYCINSVALHFNETKN